MKNIIYLILVNFLITPSIYGQNNNDSIASFELGEIVVRQDYDFENKKERKEYKELKNDLYKIYPLVVLIEDEYERINAEMELYEGEREKDFLKWYKNYVKENYMHNLSGLNHRQGRLLLKLISRQLGETPYYLLKHYLNGFQATIWQMTSHLFLANLKVDYEPEKNPMIEHVMVEIESNREVMNITRIKNNRL